MVSLVRLALSICAGSAFLVGCALRQAQGEGELPNAVQIAARQAAPASKRYEVLYRFQGGFAGAHPESGLIAVNGTLYGTSFGDLGRPNRHANGTVYSIDASRAENVLHAFRRIPSDGQRPQGGLVNVNGTLYGTTVYGGSSSACAYGCGTVFSITPSGNERLLYSFTGGIDGQYPNSLIDVDGTLYGTTAYGGVANCVCGTLFSISTSGKFTLLHDFGSKGDGSQPNGGLTYVNGALYGTTYYGGTGACGQGCGTVFTTSTSGKERVLYSFAGWYAKDGAWPAAGLIDVNGALYGTTEYGGSRCTEGCGTVFSITTSGMEKVLYSFAGGSDGASPYLAGLIDVNGTLYGTTSQAGLPHAGCVCGTVFSVSTNGKEKVLHRFAGGSDGAEPFADLIDVNGTLYGTTFYGGTATCPSGCGTVFSLVP